MKKLILAITTVAMLSGVTLNALEIETPGNGYINSRSILSVPTEWAIGFMVTAGFLAIILSNKNTDRSTAHTH